MQEMIHFSQPLWLGAGGLVCLVVVVALRMRERQRRVRLERFAAAPLLGRLTRTVSPRRRLVKKVLWLLAVACCFLALARPQYGFRMIDVKRQGIDILFALDTSRSMLTEDIRPHRLARAKLAIMDFVARLDGDRVGLLPFAGTAFLMTPLTIDYQAFEESLEAIDTAIVPKGGTDLATAISEAETTLGNNANHKILIILTDGEDLAGNGVEAATRAAAAGMTIFTVGVGTTEGELIPLPGKGPGSFVKDASGQLVTSRLDEKGLAAIAGAAGGMYAPLGKNGEGLDTIYQQKLAMIPKKELAEKQHKEPVERFRWPLAMALLSLILEFTISDRKSERLLQIPFITTIGRRIRRGKGVETVVLALVFFAFLVTSVAASQGEKAYVSGDYLTAAEVYDKALKNNPDDPRLHYNAGTAAYKNNLYDQAATSFQQALQSEDLSLQERAYFNLGNALYKKGEELMQGDPGQAEKLWRQSLDAYNGSAQLNPQAQDTRDNREVVTRKLEELEKQQKEQEDDSQQNRDGDQQQQQEKQQEKQEKGDDQGQTGQQENDGKEAQSSESPPSPSEKEGAQDQAAKQPKEDSASGQQQDEQKPTAADGEHKPEDSKDEAAKTGAPEAINPSEKRPEDANTQQPSQAAAVGNEAMTEEEARALLERLKEEEGRLNFVPGRQSGKDETEGSWKDW